jgi:hypothetical protein
MAKSLEHQIVALTRVYIAQRRRWVQNRFAVRRTGQDTHPHADDAWRWCASGALIRAGFDLTRNPDKAYRLREVACVALLPDERNPVTAIENINDSDQGHQKILHLFDDLLAQG